MVYPASRAGLVLRSRHPVGNQALTRWAFGSNLPTRRHYFGFARQPSRIGDERLWTALFVPQPRFCNHECEGGVMGRTRNCKAVTNSQLSHALVIFPRCDFDHCSYTPLDILIGGSPTGHADSHRRMPVPLRSPTPAGPIVLDIRDDPPRVFCAPERDQYLIQNHVVQDGESRVA